MKAEKNIDRYWEFTFTSFTFINEEDQFVATICDTNNPKERLDLFFCKENRELEVIGGTKEFYNLVNKNGLLSFIENEFKNVKNFKIYKQNYVPFIYW